RVRSPSRSPDELRGDYEIGLHLDARSASQMNLSIDRPKAGLPETRTAARERCSPAAASCRLSTMRGVCASKRLWPHQNSPTTFPSAIEPRFRQVSSEM